jgi:NCS1 family nucleobase:cation symporter-1
LVAPLGGADVSWIVGLAVPALLYWLVARRNTAHIPERTAYPPVPDQEPVSPRR